MEKITLNYKEKDYTFRFKKMNYETFEGLMNISSSIRDLEAEAKNLFTSIKLGDKDIILDAIDDEKRKKYIENIIKYIENGELTKEDLIDTWGLSYNRINEFNSIVKMKIVQFMIDDNSINDDGIKEKVKEEIVITNEDGKEEINEFWKTQPLNKIQEAANFFRKEIKRYSR